MNKDKSNKPPNRSSEPEDALEWLDQICQRARADQEAKRNASTDGSSGTSEKGIPFYDITDYLLGTGFQFITDAPKASSENAPAEKPDPKSDAPKTW